MDESTGHGSKTSETDNFISNVEKDDRNTVRKSKRPESVREHASNYRASIGYINKMKYGEGPRDDTDESDDGKKHTSVRDSHYNRKSNKEKLQE